MFPTLLRAVSRSWPALLAWFLLGWTVRLMLIRFAGWLGNYEALAGLLVLPLAVLARMASYVGMFVTLRRWLPHASGPDAAAGVIGNFRSQARGWADSVLVSIIPFFLVYAAWGMVRDDHIAYAASSADQIFATFDGVNRAFDIEFGIVPVMTIVVAFLGRWLLGRYAARLPRWTQAVGVYLEAVWVFLSIYILSHLIAGALDWSAHRAMIAPLVDGFAQLRAEQHWLDQLVRGWGEFWNGFGGIIVQPLAWLALAAIVYAAALPRRTGPRRPTRAARLRETASERWVRQPRWVRWLGETVSSGARERWVPFVDAAAIIRHAGFVVIGSYLLGFAAVLALNEWIVFAFYRLLGPHEMSWWIAADELVGLFADAITVPIQVALVAAALDTAIGRAAARAPSAERPAPDPTVSAAAGREAGQSRS